MPRRIPDYALQFAEFNAISTVGAFILGVSQLLFAWNVWMCVRGGQKATARVWEGSEGLEWELPSPPPHHSWEVQPPGPLRQGRKRSHGSNSLSAAPTLNDAVSPVAAPRLV